MSTERRDVATGPTNNLQWVAKDFGFFLDLIPVVEGNSVLLTAIPTVRSFLGYESKEDGENIKPVVHESHLTIKLRIGSGQGLVLSGLTSKENVTVKDKVPVLGDVPGLGALFRKSSSGVVEKRVVVLLKVRTVSAKGE